MGFTGSNAVSGGSLWSRFDAALSIESLPEGWDGYFIGNSSEISKVHISKVHINKEGSVRYCLLEEYFFGKKLEI